LFDAAILTAFEISTKSFLKIFFLVSRQSSRNPQFGIVKAVFARQLFFRQSSRYPQLVVNLSSTYRQPVVKASSRRRQPLVNRQSSIVNRQSSIVNSSSTWQKIHLFCAVFRLFPGIGVGLCYLCMRDAWRKVRNETRKKSFLKIFEKKFCSLKNGYTFA
jgi:hypothetical protein